MQINSIKLLSADSAKTLETAVAHCAPVTCLALSPDSIYLVTGSRDTTVLLWKIHRAFTSSSSSMSEPSTVTDTGTPPAASSTTATNLAEKSRRCRIEGPIHVLRGHHREILCCCVNSDLGIVVSCSQSSDVLLHSISRGRLIRRLVGVEAHSVCLSSEGVVMTWNKCQNSLNTYTLNGKPIARAQLPLSGCKPGAADFNLESEDTGEHNRLDVPSPSICFLDLYTLKVFHVLKLGEGQDITALTLNNDSTNLLVSTADKQLIIFTDPALSLKVVDQMLKLGWEGDGLSPLIKSQR
ncbi:hypothetical protein NC652_032731 [Populus alba x Populus x berolinensis]|nr:hypothetical protein NC652_032731 [Populus alba x Populus x berolinensis]